jgi:hypothetical protein
MLKKSLIFGSIVLLLAMVFALSGCSNPAGPKGDPGDQGDTGNRGDPGIPGGVSLAAPTITPAVLALAFDQGDIVILETTVTEVSGFVPKDNILYILGSAVKVSEAGIGTLTVEGTIDIWNPDGELDADGNGAGLLVATGSPTIRGQGIILLPIVIEGDEGNFIRGLHYESPEVANIVKYPGSAVDNSGDIRPFNNDTILTYFEHKKPTLTARNVDDLVPSAIPANKKLTLMGNGNVIPATSALAGYATLIVAKSATLTIPDSVVFSAAADATFINEGTVVLESTSAASSISNLGGGTITNNGEIEGSTDTLAPTPVELEILIGLPGTGTIVANHSETLTGVDNPLLQNLRIPDGVTITGPGSTITDLFTSVADNGNRTITLDDDGGSGGGKLQLLANNTKIGARVINNGLISTASLNSKVLTEIFTSMNGKGQVATTNTGTPLALAEALVIPEETILTLSGPATFGGSTDSITINGTLIVPNGAIALAPLGDVIVSGILRLGTGNSLVVNGTNKVLKILSSASDFEISGDGTITASSIEIDGKEGYSSTTGFTAKNFADSLKVITGVDSLIKDTIDLPIAPFVSLVTTSETQAIGTVDLVAASTPGGPAEIVSSPTMSGDFIGDDAFTFGTTTVTVGALTVVDQNPDAPSIPSGGSGVFEITLSANGDLLLEDTAYNGGGTIIDAFLSFNEFRIVNSGLTGPIVSRLFHIGVKSMR